MEHPTILIDMGVVTLGVIMLALSFIGAYLLLRLARAVGNGSGINTISIWLVIATTVFTIVVFLLAVFFWHFVLTK